MCNLGNMFQVLWGYVLPTVGYSQNFLKLCKASYCEGSPRFWLTYVWNKSFVVICFLTEGLEIVWTLELILWCLDSTLKVSGVLACGLLRQNKSKDGFKVHFLKVEAFLRKIPSSSQFCGTTDSNWLKTNLTRYLTITFYMSLAKLQKLILSLFLPSSSSLLWKESLRTTSWKLGS